MREKLIKSEMQNYSNRINIHGYCSNNGNLHRFSSTDVGYFWGKMCKVFYFFYSRMTDAVALMLCV